MVARAHGASALHGHACRSADASRLHLPLGALLARVIAALAMTAMLLPANALAQRDAKPLVAVILVDESGSLTPEAVEQERDAAAALIASDLSPNSRFLIAGFGSGPNAVRSYCNFIQTDGRAAREQLAACASRVQRRDASEGNDTDHAKALQYALDRLPQAPGERQPVVFLMTDGVLDVSNSANYGKTQERRNAEALRIVRDEVLPRLEERGVQVWPLGFGPEVSEPRLQEFADGGAGASASCPGSSASEPRAIVVEELSTLVHSLVEALSGARCAAVGPERGGTVDPGGSTELSVDIPALATDGAITVVKGNPSLKLTFLTPEGESAPNSGTLSGQRFERTGLRARVESLRIENPLPGRWQIKVEDPRQRGGRLSAFALWEGSLQASLFVTPEPIPGRDLDVVVRVLSRDQRPLSGKDLEGVSADATAANDRFGEHAVPLRRRGDEFRGRIKLPSDADGTITVAARVSGPGVSSDERRDSVEIQTSNFFTATFELDLGDEVHPGDEVKGWVTTTNDGPAREAALRLDGLSAGALLTIDGELGTVPNGTRRVEFILRVGPNARVGPLFGSVYVTDQDGARLAGAPFDAEVTQRPTWIEENLLLIVLVILALLLIAGATALTLSRRRRARQKDTDTRPLAVTLRRSGEELSSLHRESAAKPQSEFRVMLVDDGQHPQLFPEAASGGGGELLVITRDGRLVRVSRYEGEPDEGAIGDSFQLYDGLELTVTDDQAAEADGQPVGGPDPGSGTADTQPPNSGDWGY